MFELETKSRIISPKISPVPPRQTARRNLPKTSIPTTARQLTTKRSRRMCIVAHTQIPMTWEFFQRLTNGSESA